MIKDTHQLKYAINEYGDLREAGGLLENADSGSGPVLSVGAAAEKVFTEISEAIDQLTAPTKADAPPHWEEERDAYRGFLADIATGYNSDGAQAEAAFDVLEKWRRHE
jgi:hypothetical protein